ncbi:MAG: binding-protein-dependent transport system inner rane component [Chloroflexi bacterium]|nr:binding-protein-dependent transport system inner rane component [Chloroflexota bacterium]
MLEALLVLVALIFLVPFAYLISTSLKPETQLFSRTIDWIPHPFKWANYSAALNEFPFMRYFANTMIICIPVVIGATASSSFVAYGFSRIIWPGREALFIVVLGTLILPYQVTMIPLFLLFRHIGWVNTFFPLIVPSFFGNAFFIFLFRQFYLGLPSELSDAARIDGCSELGIYTRIILPLSKPVLATAAIFAFIGAWSDFLGPLIYLNDASKYTLSIGVQQVIGMEPHWTQLMAIGVMMTMPILILFFFVQRTFIQGISFSGIKG